MIDTSHFRNEWIMQNFDSVFARHRFSSILAKNATDVQSLSHIAHASAPYLNLVHQPHHPSSAEFKELLHNNTNICISAASWFWFERNIYFSAVHLQRSHSMIHNILTTLAVEMDVLEHFVYHSLAMMQKPFNFSYSAVISPRITSYCETVAMPLLIPTFCLYPLYAMCLRVIAANLNEITHKSKVHLKLHFLQLTSQETLVVKLSLHGVSWITPALRESMPIAERRSNLCAKYEIPFSFRIDEVEKRKTVITIQLPYFSFLRSQLFNIATDEIDVYNMQEFRTIEAHFHDPLEWIQPKPKRVRKKKS